MIGPWLIGRVSVVEGKKGECILFTGSCVGDPSVDVWSVCDGEVQAGCSDRGTTQAQCLGLGLLATPQRPSQVVVDVSADDPTLTLQKKVSPCVCALDVR